ncbi:MAG: hypothetical protein A2289_08005 [Deltaproteobacteria bacterium RIFOXYA12_FULL_58_15]|nr:MAG: hypothetical protein A2289_08005 [Deltaproteobacteria bacterium RIFOXYA12_FULL_58_15]OGR10356.1 MAG: hypothetical protein A2341_22835 [Deltaproteobacteria bacterium RIFOXYB12_FULL_58_9]
MGQVYRARADGAGPDVVLKCVHAKNRASIGGDLVHMFLDEARISTLVNHPNVVRAHEVDYCDGFYYLVMEWLRGWDLRSIHSRLTKVGEELPQALAVRFAVEAARGLHAAHECTTDDGERLELVHRDIGQANLFVTNEGTLKVLDFGVAKSSIQVARTVVGVVKGKMAYMSPEQCVGDPLDRRSDIFSLGVVLHELLSGSRLFKREGVFETINAITSGFIPPPTRKNEPVGDDLLGVLMRALQRDKNLRFSTAAEFADALVKVKAYEPQWKKSEVAAYLEALFGDVYPAQDIETQPQDNWAENDTKENRWEHDETQDIEVTTSVDGPNKAAIAWLTSTRPMYSTTKELAPIKKSGSSKRVLALLGAVLLALGGWVLLQDLLTEPGPTAELPNLTDATTDSLSDDLALTPPVVPDETTSISSLSTGDLQPATPHNEETHRTEVAKSARALKTPKPGKTPSKRSPTPTATKKHGRLTLEARPWANVYMGNKLLGTTPLIGVLLPAGEVKLRLENPEASLSREITVIVPEGGTVKNSISLR